MFFIVAPPCGYAPAYGSVDVTCGQAYPPLIPHSASRNSGTEWATICRAYRRWGLAWEKFRGSRLHFSRTSAKREFFWCSPVSQLRVDSSLFVFDQCDQCSSAVRCWCWFPITAITRDHGDYGDSPSLAFLILCTCHTLFPHERTNIV